MRPVGRSSGTSRRPERLEVAEEQGNLVPRKGRLGYQLRLTDERGCEGRPLTFLFRCSRLALRHGGPLCLPGDRGLTTVLGQNSDNLSDSALLGWG